MKSTFDLNPFFKLFIKILVAYQSVKVVDTSPKKPSANFLSGTQRDPSEVKAMLGTEEMRPDPGSYIIPDPRRSIMGGVHRRNAQYAFGSNQSRFGIKGAHRVDNNYRFYDVTQNLGNSGFRKKLRSRGNMTNCGFVQIQTFFLFFRR